MSKLANIVKWKRRTRPTDFTTTADGALEGTVYTPHGSVGVFSYRGGGYGQAFTKFWTYLPPYQYEETRPLSYGRLSLTRMAQLFASRCAAMKERDG